MGLVAEKIIPGVVHDIYVLHENDRCEMHDFIDELAQSNCNEHNKLISLLDRSASNGTPQNPEKFKRLQDRIYEFKTTGGIRVACFFDGRKVIILTQGFKKKKSYSEEIRRALVLRVKYFDSKMNATLTLRGEDL